MLMSLLAVAILFYSIRAGGNKRTGWAEFFHLLHEKRVRSGVKNIFITYMKNEIRVGQKLQKR